MCVKIHFVKQKQYKIKICIVISGGGVGLLD